MEGTTPGQQVYEQAILDIAKVFCSFGFNYTPLTPEPATWGSVAEILSAMGKTISAGWVKGSLITTRGMCMLGAFTYGSGAYKGKDSEAGIIIGELLAGVIKEEYGTAFTPFMSRSGWDTVVTFNDDRRIILADVLKVIGKALTIAQAKEDAGEELHVPVLEVKTLPASFQMPVMQSFLPLPQLATA